MLEMFGIGGTLRKIGFLFSNCWIFFRTGFLEEDGLVDIVAGPDSYKVVLQDSKH